MELRKEYGLGFNVWVMAVGNDYKDAMARMRTDTWSVPSQASSGDLVLYYRTRPDKFITDVFRIAGLWTTARRLEGRKGLDGPDTAGLHPQDASAS